MIRIRKPANPPRVLVTLGILECQELIRRAQDGEVEFDFDRSIYAHKEVKSALLRAQYEKCAFCESKISHIAYGDVEHFRPKAAVLVNGSLTKPAYYWLAYDWSNLYLCCQICNQRHKGNAFPILGTLASVSNPNLAAERQVFIDPGQEDPLDHIEFIDSIPHGKTARGQETIKALGLQREALNAQRRTMLRLHRLLLDSLTLLIDQTDTDALPVVQNIMAELCAAMKDEAEYAAMSKSFILSHPLAPRISLVC
jgi:uncharacterized protein (TIGR02646 family)